MTRLKDRAKEITANEIKMVKAEIGIGVLKPSSIKSKTVDISSLSMSAVFTFREGIRNYR